MRGFKTFADKTEMGFGPGITAIVGPNGVGKSNVTDAILWALGEQSARTLRTESLQDVVFAGSERRRPLNMAEVSIILDNSDHALHTDYSEVVITRRVFRDGNSEYLINNSSCRLRDVRELLLDTGVGPKAYSVVGQGEIDAILSIRSEDRRELLEEVAGVRKYRVRRSEAERKLEATEINLTRVSDIVHELRSQREPLEEMAQAARIYKELDEKLRQVELYLLGADYRRHAEKRGQLANEVAIAQADLQATRNRISEVDAEYQKLAAAIVQLENELEKVRLEALRLQREAAAERERRAVNQERLRTLRSREEFLATELEQMAAREGSLVQQQDALLQEQQALSARLESEQTVLREQQQTYEARLRAVREHQQRATELEEQRVKSLQNVARLENEAAALASLEADLTERVGRLQSQQEQLAARLRTTEAALEAGETTLDGLREAVQQATHEVVQREGDVAKIQAVIREQNVKRGILSEAISRLESRRAVLAELRDSYEGYSEGTRNLMAAGAEGKLQGLRGVLGEMLEVPERFETAVEAALGDKLQWVLANGPDDALQALEYLREHDLGRAALFPLTSLARSSTEVPNLSGVRSGCLGLAGKLIGVSRPVASALEPILNRIIVCEDLPSALEVFKRFGARFVVVTLAGEVIEPQGVLRGGALEGGASQGFSRQRELDGLEQRIESLRLSLGRMFRIDEQLEELLGQARQEQERSNRDLTARRDELLQQEADFRHLQDQSRAAAEARAETEAEIDRLQKQLGEAAERQRQALAQGEQLRARLGELEAAIETARREAGTSAEREELRQALTQRQVTVAELRQKLAGSQELCARAEQDLTQSRQQLAAAQLELSHITDEMARLNEALTSTSADGADQIARAAELEDQAASKAEVLMRLRDKGAEADAKRRELSQVQEDQTQRLHAADLSLMRSEAQLQAIGERLADTYNTTPEAAAEVTLQDMSETEARRQAGHFRAEMRRLGNVNLSSIDECERLKAREEFLENQRGDLLQAKADLLQVIHEMDEAAKEAFMETFQKVAVEFDELFKKLFEGGQTELKLTNEEDPLNAGVEVIVTPPGKRQQNLLLLSGGERAMTALALLFALLRVKPSPFCVMDEIDAALDAANTDRFGNMIREFAVRSQFILITHNPRTMEKVDVLHGITMQEPGVSKLISVQLEEAQREAQQRATAQEVEA